MKYSGGGDYHGGNKPDIASETKKQSDNSIRVGSETQENSAVVFLLHHYSLFEACIFIQNYDSIRDAINHFIATYPNDRKAIFVPSVENLSNVNWVCKLMGLHYPDDVALLGYVLEDNTSASASELSVISQPIAQMCKEALSLITERISDGDSSSEPITKAIPASLIIRNSTIIK